ncbi:MAG: hypothetical protein HY673_16780 [Chloroflexi bacterium]|nr:hypothetical protein [Chloroflexota bacterium]
MVIKKEIVLEKLKELDTIVQELALCRDRAAEEIASSLSLRWMVERGLIATAGLILDVAEHILSGRFGVCPQDLRRFSAPSA